MAGIDPAPGQSMHGVLLRFNTESFKALLQSEGDGHAIFWSAPCLLTLHIVSGKTENYQLNSPPPPFSELGFKLNFPSQIATEGRDSQD